MFTNCSLSDHHFPLHQSTYGYRQNRPPSQDYFDRFIIAVWSILSRPGRPKRWRGRFRNWLSSSIMKLHKRRRQTKYWKNKLRFEYSNNTDSLTIAMIKNMTSSIAGARDLILTKITFCQSLKFNISEKIISGIPYLRVQIV